ncbi:hypothetical protein ACHAQA_007657 [Verticillium albo-atrum]
MVNFSLSSHQVDIRRAAAQFATEELGSAYDSYHDLTDQEARFRATKPFYESLIKAGYLKAFIPTNDGGSNESFVDMSLIIEEFYAVNSSVNIALIGTALGLLPLILGGTPEQKERYLKPFLSAEGDHLASLTHSEPGGTANFLEKGGKGLGVTAQLDGDCYVVNGEKLWTTNSGGWDYKGATLSCLCVRYSDDGGSEKPDVDPASNVMILLVTRDIIAQNDPGAFTIISEPNLMGHTAATGPHTRYTNFKVPVDSLLVAPGGPTVSLIETAFGITAALVGAMACGTTRAAFEAALKFAREDHRGGSVPIIERQSVADLLINCKIKIDTSRLLVRHALDSLDRQTGTTASRFESCLEAKIFSGDSAVQAVWEAMQVVGMTSYQEKSGFPRLFNDAAVFALFDGGNVGIRRRQYEKLMQAPDYDPWKSTF